MVFALLVSNAWRTHTEQSGLVQHRGLSNGMRKFFLREHRACLGVRV
jgi:hypothetical protein